MTAGSAVTRPPGDDGALGRVPVFGRAEPASRLLAASAPRRAAPGRASPWPRGVWQRRRESGASHSLESAVSRISWRSFATSPWLEPLVGRPRSPYGAATRRDVLRVLAVFAAALRPVLRTVFRARADLFAVLRFAAALRAAVRGVLDLAIEPSFRLPAPGADEGGAERRLTDRRKVLYLLLLIQIQTWAHADPHRPCTLEPEA